tara:strand:+ start:152 stop:496 length:345 start_codon:yes stop_codon:yes gene_type:complete
MKLTNQYLRKIIKEEYVKILKKKNITEAKKLDQKYLNKIHKLTQRNNHTEARIFLSTMMRNKKLLKFYNAMNDLNAVFGGYGPELSKLNQKMEQELYKNIKKNYANSAEVIGLL